MLSRINSFAESQARIAKVRIAIPSQSNIDSIESFSPYIYIPEENLISILKEGYVPRSSRKAIEPDISPIWNQSSSAVYGEILPDPKQEAIRMMNRNIGASRYGELF